MFRTIDVVLRKFHGGHVGRGSGYAGTSADLGTMKGKEAEAFSDSLQKGTWKPPAVRVIE